MDVAVNSASRSVAVCRWSLRGAIRASGNKTSVPCPMNEGVVPLGASGIWPADAGRGGPPDGLFMDLSDAEVTEDPGEMQEPGPTQAPRKKCCSHCGDATKAAHTAARLSCHQSVFSLKN